MTELVCENCATPLPGGSKYCNECGTPVPGQEPGASEVYGFPTDLRQALLIATSGEYEIHHELGRGGMGSVFLAREIGLDRLVAIKVLPPTLMFDEGLIVRFTREARMVAKLHHPNIIPVYRVHHSHNLAFYTMHFVSGRSLGEIMGSSRVLTMREVEQTMLESAAGLGYAHKRGVIHRDVKPANILLDAEGSVHLTDFGIAKALVGNTQLTETGAVIGTPQYMAPEQCDGRCVDGRADQYSLAIVGYQLIAGHPPFEADSMKELIYHHLFTAPKPLSEIRSDTPVPLTDAIHKALSKDPADRFNSMEDFCMAIEGKGPPVFVKWIDETADGRKKKKKRGRRATDMPTTQRIPDLSWTIGDGQEDAPRLSSYQRAVAALAVAAISISAVGVLALSSGAGLAGSLRGGGSADPAEDIMLSRVDVPSPDPNAEDNGSSELNTEAIDQPGTNSTNAVDHVGTNGEPARGRHVENGGDDVQQNVPTQASAMKTVAQPVSQPMLVPRALVDSIDARLQQARLLFNAERYVSAQERFNEVKRWATDALGDYRDTGDLARLVQEADAELRNVALVCSRRNIPNCS